MDTQNTPVHIKLWHREFWFMTLAGMLLSTSMYMLVPPLAMTMASQLGFSNAETAVVILAQGVGIFLLGGLVSYLTQRYRRNIICLRAIALLTFTGIALYYLLRTKDTSLLFAALCLIRLAQGAFYGLARMVLGSTLIIDTCESFRRTEANHAAGWFSRFGIAIGPALGITLYSLYGTEIAVAAATGLCVAAFLLIATVKFPFKAPEEIMKKLSLDRFWLTKGWILSLNLFIFTAALGTVIISIKELHFFATMTFGFFIALIAQRMLFAKAELKSEIVSGTLLVCASILVLTTCTHATGATIATTELNVAGTLLGCGTGLANARFLLCFIKMSDHCQRGTAQSTFLLSAESGVAAGMAWGIIMADSTMPILYQALALTTTAMIMYIAFTHTWYMKNKQR